MSESRLSAGIAAKAIGGYSDSDLDVLRSSVDFTQEAASGSQFNFFDGTASSGEVESNYIENPLPTASRHDVVALGFSLHPTLTSDNLPDPLLAYQAFTNAYIEFQTSERDTLIQVSESSLIEIENHSIDLGTRTDQNGNQVEFDRVNAQNTMGAIRLPDPITIESREVFDFTLDVHNQNLIPSAGDYSDLPSAPAQITAFMEVAPSS